MLFYAQIAYHSYQLLCLSFQFKHRLRLAFLIHAYLFGVYYFNTQTSSYFTSKINFRCLPITMHVSESVVYVKEILKLIVQKRYNV